MLQKPVLETLFTQARSLAEDAELSVKLLYPNYRKGLAALWADGSWRG